LGLYGPMLPFFCPPAQACRWANASSRSRLSPSTDLRIFSSTDSQNPRSRVGPATSCSAKTYILLSVAFATTVSSIFYGVFEQIPIISRTFSDMWESEGIVQIVLRTEGPWASCAPPKKGQAKASIQGRNHKASRNARGVGRNHSVKPLSRELLQFTQSPAGTQR
jgi:hypothetical protein